MPNLTKEATSFMYAASCNNSAASLTDFYFLSPVPTAPLVIRRVYAALPVLSPQDVWFLMEHSNVLFAKGTYYTEWILYLQMLVLWDSDPRGITHPRRGL